MKFILYISVMTALLNLALLATEKPGAEKKNISTGSIEGRVTDTEGNQIPGVNVFLQNTTIGVATDKNGEFLLRVVPTGSYRLIASMVGYESGNQSIEVRESETTTVEFRLRPSFYETGTVVITGTATPYLFEESPVKTEVIPRKLIERTKSSNLAEALGLQTGVRVENNCQNCNFTQVRILGFEGKYSQILMDGDPMVSSLAGVYALEQFPQEMIGQLEVVKGGGSSLYGAGAIAGTINIISQKPQTNRTRVNYLGRSIEDKLDNQIGIMSELVSKDGRTGAFIFGSARNRAEYDRNDDGYSELGQLSDETIGFNWFYKPNINNQLNISFHRIHEERRGGNDFNLPQHEADIAEWLEHERWGGKVRWEHSFGNTLDYSLFYSLSKVKRDSYYGGLADEDGDGMISNEEQVAALDFYGATDNITQNLGGRTNLLVGINKFTAGFEYFNDKLEDSSVKDPRYHIDHSHNNFGAYLQDDISLMNNHLNVVAGARVDKHSELDDPIISPRINVKWEAIEGVDFRASFSTGFKPPATFDEDLHIESLGGEQRVIRNIPGLREESSKSVTAGFEYQGFFGDVAFLFGITGFYTSLDDAFSTRPVENNTTDLILWERYNSDGAKVSGVEIDMGLKPLSELEIRAGVTYKTGKYDSEQEIFDGKSTDKFLRTPDTYGYIRLIYDVHERVNLFSAMKYTGKMVVPNESTEEIAEPDKVFFEFDLGLSYKAPMFDNFGGKITLGVKNLFDSYQDDLGVGADRDPAYLYGPQLPRYVYFGLGTEF